MSIRTSLYQRALFPLTDYVFNRNTFSAYKSVNQLQTLSRDELRAYQFKKLKELIDYSFEFVPYYKEIFTKLGISPHDVRSIEDLSRLPVLTKADVRENYSNLVSGQYDKKHLLSISTSGSTGTPLIVLSDQEANAWRRAVNWHHHSWWSINIGERGAVIWLQPIEGWRGIFNKRLGFFLNNCNTFLNVSRLTEQEMWKFWRQLHKRKIAYIYGYTSAVTTFARFILRNKLNEKEPLNLKTVIITTETLFPSQRECMEKAFSCKVANEYGCSEMGPIAFECPAGSMHISAETYLVEAIPPYFPKDNGIAGQAVVTFLAQKSMPLIRYVLGDLVHISDRSCACGRSLPIIESVEGRISDIITTPSGRVIHSEVFDYIMRECSNPDNPAVIKFRAIQNSETQFELMVEKGPAFSEKTKDGITQQFWKVFGKECNISVVEVEDIPSDPSGKFRFFISKVQK